MKTFTRLGVATGTVLLGLGLAAPAHAGSYTYYDKGGDVWKSTCTYTESTDDYDCVDEAAPTVTDGDVIASSVQHRARKVVLRTRYRELTKGEDFQVQIGDIRTNENIRRYVNVFHDAEDGSSWAGIFSPRNGEVSCSLGKTIDFTANVIEVRIPRACLSQPRWVQVGLGHVRFNWSSETVDGVTTETDVTYFDDAQSGYRTTLKLSPRVYRG